MYFEEIMSTASCVIPSTDTLSPVWLWQNLSCDLVPVITGCRAYSADMIVFSRDLGSSGLEL